MKFIATALDSVRLIEIDPAKDSRGYFARLWCREEFRRQGIDMDIVQVSVSHSKQRGTLRGMHFQWPPSQEGKLVRCQRGSLHDVVIDLRPSSPTFMNHQSFVLDGSQHTALYVPPGFAHGFQTLQADTDVLYMMSDFYRPDLQQGFRHDDPRFGIIWPLTVTEISSNDQQYSDFNPDTYREEFLQRTNIAKQSPAPPATSSPSG